MDTTVDVDQMRAWCLSVKRQAERFLEALDAMDGLPAQDPRGFDTLARSAGLPKKRLYTVAEVSKVSGVPKSTLYDAISAGGLRSFTPPGRERGQLVAPEWFDDWMDGGDAPRKPARRAS